MNQNITFNAYVMSYKRSEKIMTKKYLEYCTYVVRESEEQLYRDAGVEDLLVIPEGRVYDFMSTFYWIIQNTKEDVICILDDDIEEFYYRITKNTNVGKEEVTLEIERIAQLLVDLGLGLAFNSVTPTVYAYSQEFMFKGVPGPVRWVNKSKFKAEYNPEDPACSDLDMVYQELLKNRIILRPMYLTTKALMDVNDGIAEDRQEHIQFVHAMHNKWMKYYSYNFNKNYARINIER